MTRIAVRAALVLVLLWCTAIAGHAEVDEEYDFILDEVFTGETYTLEQLTRELPLVLHVWGPNCPYCLRHMPYFAAFYKKVDLEDANVYTASVDGTVSEIKEYMSEKDLGFPVLNGKGCEGMGDHYAGEGWPTTYVFAPGGGFVGFVDTVGPSYITEVLDMIDEAWQQ